MALSEQGVWKLLDEVLDPEIPVVSLVEMGIVRSVEIQEDKVTVVITPTFSGCPALIQMETDIKASLTAAGFAQVDIKTVNSPAWSSDWIVPAAREKLKTIGLAPPPRHGGLINLDLLDIAVCPYCGSENTELKNSFGSTLCRMIFYCHNCRQPFEQFKPL